MRVFTPLVVTLSLVAAALLVAQGQPVDATKVLTDAREALGGEKHLSAVKTFIATGRTRQVRGNNLVPIVFEISCELPDKFVRIDEFPAQDTDPTTLGFNGDDLIQFPPPPPGPGRAGGGSPPPAGRAAGMSPPSPGRGSGPPSPEGGRSAGPPLSPSQQRVANVKQDFARLTLGMFAPPFAVIR